jgi:tetratricopeptide (TPR) repeat protein
MKRIFIVLTLIVSAASFGQTPNRVDAILDVAYNRMTDQTESWFKVGDYPRICEVLRYMNQIWPDDYESATNLGFMLGNTERYGEELATYMTYRGNNPKVADAPLPEAEFYFRTRTYARIPPILEPAVTKKPHPNMYRILAHAYERLNLFSDSKRIWDLYINAVPTDLGAVKNRERVTLKLRGQFKKS